MLYLSDTISKCVTHKKSRRHSAIFYPDNTHHRLAFFNSQTRKLSNPLLLKFAPGVLVRLHRCLSMLWVSHDKGIGHEFPSNANADAVAMCQQVVAVLADFLIIDEGAIRRRVD